MSIEALTGKNVFLLSAFLGNVTIFYVLAGKNVFLLSEFLGNVKSSIICFKNALYCLQISFVNSLPRIP